MSTPSSFRETAARRLAEDARELPSAISDFLEDTRTLAVRRVPISLIAGYTSAQPGADEPEQVDESLLASVRELGVLEPILVRPRHGGGFELVAGRRRLLAARASGMRAIPAVVRQIDDATLARLRAAEFASPLTPELPRNLVRGAADATPSPTADGARPSVPPTLVPRRIIREPRVISGPTEAASARRAMQDGLAAQDAPANERNHAEDATSDRRFWSLRRFRRGNTADRD